MKLRNLTGAIRKVDGPVFVILNTPIGALRVPLQKSGLLDAIKAQNITTDVDTGMRITDDGVMTWREAVPSQPERRAAPASLLDDDDQIDLEDAIAAAPAKPAFESLLDD